MEEIMAERLPVLYNKKPCYDIVFSKGFAEFEKELIELGCEEKKICVVTDSTVAELYADEVAELIQKVSKKVVRFVFEAGEASKNLDVVKKLYTFLIEEKFERKDMLIALGGGVVGDLTGYTAATYLRGIDFIQVPTTLLAQCDSSIGGKTGVDFDGYKNMVGAFKMPRLVYMNLQVLSTLEDRQFFSGFAEVMKYGLIKDHIFYEWLIENMYEICERNMDVLLEMVMRSCAVKKMVVEKDPTEQGERALLNLGHTIGHAIEKYMDFTLLHGECVSLGMVAAAHISMSRNLISSESYTRIIDLLKFYQLPVSFDDIKEYSDKHIDVNKIVEFTKSDKKADGNKIKFVLISEIGKAFIDTSVTEEEIANAVIKLGEKC